jgi:hypothetical protein
MEVLENQEDVERREAQFQQIKDGVYEIICAYLVDNEIVVHVDDFKKLEGKAAAIEIRLDGTVEDHTITLILRTEDAGDTPIPTD